MITLPLTDNAALLPHADGWLWIPANLPIRVRPGDLDLTVAEWLAANHTEQPTPGEDLPAAHRTPKKPVF